LYDPNEEEQTGRSVTLLRESSLAFVQVCVEGVGCVQEWVGGVRKGRLGWILGRVGLGNMEEWEKANLKKRQRVEKMRSYVGDALHKFRNVDR
jgi:hypothetical protein